VIADAIWDQLPYYGAAERTVDGALALALEIPPSMTSARILPPLNETSLAYCIATRRIVFPSAVLAGGLDVLIVWARLVEPYQACDLDVVASGVRVSLLHADS
jgi:hypothetical protein